MGRRLLIAGLVLATLLLAGLGACISLVRSIRTTLAPSTVFERSTTV
ncbi:MAG TPA: hypothetical protein VFU52_00740 [Gaiellaceae bacterium]|nr:hypothetical protein [Gaiellaceae bacterium]HEU5404579.1 hypothetical protein [Gaiellaceae bacterium]